MLPPHLPRVLLLVVHASCCAQHAPRRLPAPTPNPPKHSSTQMQTHSQTQTQTQMRMQTRTQTEPAHPGACPTVLPLWRTALSRAQWPQQMARRHWHWR